VIWSLLSIIDTLAAFIGKKQATRSRTHFENERQRSVNDIWHFIMGKQSVMWPLLSEYDVLTGSVG